MAAVVAILFLLVLATLPRWPYSVGWGWYPSAALAVVMLAALIALTIAWA